MLYLYRTEHVSNGRVLRRCFRTAKDATTYAKEQAANPQVRTCTVECLSVSEAPMNALCLAASGAEWIEEVERFAVAVHDGRLIDLTIKRTHK